MSLRSRVAILVVVAVSAVLVVVGFVVPALVRDYLVARMDDQLEDARFIAPGVIFARRTAGDAPRGGPSATFAGAYVELRADDGTLQVGQFVDPTTSTGLSAPALPEQIDTARLDEPFTVESVDGGTTEWRVLVVTRPAPPANSPSSSGFSSGYVVIALPTTGIEQTVGQVFRIELIVGIVSVTVLAAAVWFLVGVGLGPLRRMERTAASINGTDHLDQRVDHPSPRTELGRLGVTLNDMLARLQDGFEVQQSSEARLRRFVSDASHELRTPLTSIRGYAELYRRGGDQPEQVERSMSRIEDETKRMTTLVDDLLALARLDERAPIERLPVDLRSVVDEVVGDARVVDPERSLTIDGAASCPILGDRFRLTQAVANLVGNARTHTAPGTPIEVMLTSSSGHVTVAVIDHGAGLTDDAKAQVFDRFYRADPSRSRQHGGAGLGLAITSAIAKSHGGAVSVRDTPGGGATFELVVPGTAS